MLAKQVDMSELIPKEAKLHCNESLDTEPKSTEESQIVVITDDSFGPQPDQVMKVETELEAIPEVAEAPEEAEPTEPAKPTKITGALIVEGVEFYEVEWENALVNTTLECDLDESLLPLKAEFDQNR